MVELVYASDLKSEGLRALPVRVWPRAPLKTMLPEDRPLTSKQEEVLKACPEGPFVRSSFKKELWDLLPALLYRGLLERFVCNDPSSVKVTYILTESGKKKKEQLINGGRRLAG